MNHERLSGKTIVMAVTGSIAAVETVKLAHELRRQGAVVQPVMSQAACGIIHPDALTYACGNETITRISGLVEHVKYCGANGIADLLLIAPCTANTIAKIATAIDDTPVTTFATTAIGRGMPVILVPAMHHAMFRHKILISHLKLLSSIGITVINPRIEEGKAKIASNEEIVLWSGRLLSGMLLKGKKVVITSGRCEEPVDDVRIITTRSSGKMGQELAYEAFRLGADVTIIHNDLICIGENIKVTTATSMHQVIREFFSKKKVDIYISSAAISDFAPEIISGKIPSGKPVSIRLNPLPKILNEVVGKASVIVGFKLGSDSLKKAGDLLSKGVTMVASNTAENLGTVSGNYTLTDKFGSLKISGDKHEIAESIFNRILQYHL